MSTSRKSRGAREEKAAAREARAPARPARRKLQGAPPDDTSSSDSASSAQHGDEPTRDGFRATPREDRAG
jgi:hypothetical protein